MGSKKAKSDIKVNIKVNEKVKLSYIHEKLLIYKEMSKELAERVNLAKKFENMYAKSYKLAKAKNQDIDGVFRGICKFKKGKYEFVVRDSDVENELLRAVERIKSIAYKQFDVSVEKIGIDRKLKQKNYGFEENCRLYNVEKVSIDLDKEINPNSIDYLSDAGLEYSISDLDESKDSDLVEEKQKKPQYQMNLTASKKDDLANIDESESIENLNIDSKELELLNDIKKWYFKSTVNARVSGGNHHGK